MPGRAPWHDRLAALAALLAVGLGGQAAGFIPINGSGSTWGSNALDHWRRGVGDLDGIAVNFSADGSTHGRNDFRVGQVDFAVSELPYGGSDGGVPDPPPARAFGYLPIVGGGTASMYNLTIGDKRVTNLRLSGETIAKIFTQEITNWADPAIKADNPGLALPTRHIVPVVRVPVGAKATTTTFMVIPSGPVIQGTPVILVAQVAPANAAGTVQFKDGDSALGPPRPVFGGFALAVTSKLTKGAHSLTAVFTATNQDAFGSSVPTPVSLSVIGLS